MLLSQNNGAVLRYEIRTWLGLYPNLFFPAMRLFAKKGSRDRLLASDTQIVIEGYPRSANTFALVAFEFAQAHPVRMAHHLHAPAQIIRAVQRHIPALVLIRDPEDALISMFAYSSFPAKPLLEAYYWFYKGVLPYSHGFVSATFEEVTTDYGRVIRTVNERFGLNFGIFEHTKENVAKCFEIIEGKAALLSGGHAEGAEAIVARPSADRERSKQKHKELLAEPSLVSLLGKCCKVYDEFRAAGQT